MGLVDRVHMEEEKRETSEALASLTERVRGLEEQQIVIGRHLTDLTTAVRELREATAESSDTAESMLLLRQLNSRLSEIDCGSGATSKSDVVELSGIASVFGEIAETLDIEKLSEASMSMRRTAVGSERMMSSAAEKLSNQADQMQRSNEKAIRGVRDAATSRIEKAADAAANAAESRVDALMDRRDKQLARAEHVWKHADWAAPVSMALALLPVATVLLMGVMSLWTIVNGFRWVFAMDAALWLRIITGIALTGLLAGSGWGLWKLARWVREKLR